MGFEFNKTLFAYEFLNSFLFSWDEISENGEGLINFLKWNYSIDWVKTAKIEKIDDNKTIRITKEKNFLSLRLNNEKTKVNLEIDDGRTEELIAKMENGKLNIYLINPNLFYPNIDFVMSLHNVFDENQNYIVTKQFFIRWDVTNKKYLLFLDYPVSKHFFSLLKSTNSK